MHGLVGRVLVQMMSLRAYVQRSVQPGQYASTQVVCYTPTECLESGFGKGC